ncbi:MAG: SUMF1/EgtB/PvdO family nonheme iron enzyme [Acidobacteria bacterium]|jgi:formylglycine-generating enzyme required for sulfatase activity|nr:SUMF1/EgtB/PvdO family nonheme iron enzyme [Acidobacteriota bacterium]
MNRNRPSKIGLLVVIAVAWPWSSEVIAGDCPSDMVAVEAFCIDLYEAPNTNAGSPLVMYTFDEAEVWCQARGRRLCYDDEWTRACEGPSGLSYPYGNNHVPGLCNDDEAWLAYNQTLLNQWPMGVSDPDVDSFAELLAAARAVSASAASSADHVETLYQAEPAGSNVGCISSDGVIDLCGNAEEWTRRRDGGAPGFSGNLKGRYWAEARTCQQNVTGHGDSFRFYELGFRCCLDIGTVFSDGFESGNTDLWSTTSPG